MFNPQKVFNYLIKILGIVIPILAITFLLSFLTEYLTTGDEILDLLSTWEFWLAMGLNMLPIIVVMSLVLWLASRFVKQVFQLENQRKASNFLLYSRFGQPSFGPWMKIDQKEIMGDEGLKRIGGPGNLVVYNDTALVLEARGRATKVVGRGFPPLAPFEKIYNIIDLRPKTYEYDVSAMSKEGIPINWSVEVRYQIDDGGKKPTEEEPYPYSEEAVLKAGTCGWRREKGFRFGQDMDWEGRVVVSETEGSLRSILARRPLDELIGLTASEAEAARESIQAELERELRQSVPKLGAKILGVKLDNLQVEDRITQQWIKNWKAAWERWSAGKVARSEADYIQMYEVEKARVQIQFITDLARGIQKLLDNNILSPQAINRVIQTRLFSMIDRASFYASSRVFAPSPTREMVDSMMQLPSGAVPDVKVEADTDSISPGDISNISVEVLDQYGKPVADGTNVTFNVYPALGTITVQTPATINGLVEAIFTAGPQLGKVYINAQCGQGSGTISVEIV